MEISVKDWWRIEQKGGPGSGNFGHSGRAGEVGGSGGSGGGGSYSKSAKSNMKILNLTEEDFNKLSSFQNLETKFSVKESETIDKGIVFKGTFKDKTGNDIMNIEFSIPTAGPNANQTTFDLMEVNSNDQSRGYAKEILGRIEDISRKANKEKIELLADITIGPYAWAKQGFDYSDKNKLKEAQKDLKGYIMSVARPIGLKVDKGILNEQIMKCKTPEDIANFKVKGLEFSAKQLKKLNGFENEGITGDHLKTIMHIGKAFMLDNAGHGDWIGVKKL